MATKTTDEHRALIAPLEEPYREFWQALGSFIGSFTATEQSAHRLLWTLCGVENDIGRAVSSGLRWDAVKDAINRVLDSTGDKETKEQLAAPFAHLGLINGVRNNVVHWKTAPEGDGSFVVSNRFSAWSAEKVKEYSITPSDLQKMSSDLFSISHHFTYQVWSRGPGGIPEQSKELLLQIMKMPWQYKQSQQSGSRKTSSNDQKLTNPVGILRT